MRPAANVTMLYPDRSLHERLAAAAADGFAGVEILFPYDLDHVALAELAHQLRRHNLTHVLVNTPQGPSGERGLAAVPGREDDFRRGLDEALAVAATRADAVGVTLTLEALNHHDMPGYAYARPSQVLAVIAAVDHPCVRLQFDLYHSAREELDLVAELERARPHIHHVQIAGSPERHEPDLADTALLAAVRHLATWGYDGWLGFEYNPRGDTSTGLAWRSGLP